MKNRLLQWRESIFGGHRTEAPSLSHTVRCEEPGEADNTGRTDAWLCATSLR